MAHITTVDEQSHNKTTFRFGCGRIQHIDDQVIQQIPYLSAIVSIANYVSNIKDEDGHILLDSNINFDHFNIIIDALPFSDVYKTLVHISQYNDFDVIIMLADFLGLIVSGMPTLDEIDSFFFSAWIFKPSIREWEQHQVSLTIPDVAVLFITGLIRGDYDSTNDRVIQRIYWYIMFIISAHTVFRPILRSHLQRASEEYFQLYKPSLIPRLQKLSTTTKRYEDRYNFSNSMSKIKNNESNDSVCDRVSKTYIDDPTNKRRLSILMTYLSGLLYTHENEVFGHKKINLFTECTLANVVAEMIDPCLDLQVRGIFVQQIYNYEAIHRSFVYGWWDWSRFLHDVIEDNAVREWIRSLIIEGMPANIEKTREKHQILHKALEACPKPIKLAPMFLFGESYSSCQFRRLKKETDECEILLNRLIEGKSILDKIEQDVINELYSLSIKRIRQLVRKQDYIFEFHQDAANIYPAKDLKKKLFQLNAKRERQQKHQLRSSNKPKRRLKQS